MNKRALLTTLIGLGLVILAVILVIKALSGGSDTPLVERTPITSYADTATDMQFTAAGPIVAQEDHESIRITIGRDERKVELLRGYEGAVVAEKTFANTQAAYTEFLNALNRYNYTEGEPSQNATEEVAGRCSSGTRFIFGIVEGGRDVETRWSTSCGGGTYKGSRNAVIRLFRTQIPEADFREITRGANVSLSVGL